MCYFTWKLELVSNILWAIVDQFRYGEFIGGIDLIFCGLEVPLFGKVGPKNKKCQCKVQFCTQRNSKIQRKTVVSFSVRQKTSILLKIGSKIHNYLFKVKFGASNNSNLDNSMVMFTYLFLAGNILFGKFWSKKTKL